VTVRRLGTRGESGLSGAPSAASSTVAAMKQKLSSRKQHSLRRKLVNMARVDLRRVAKARRRLEAALKERDDAILAAVASGETYRDVARIAGLSFQRIAQIVSKSRQA